MVDENNSRISCQEFIKLLQIKDVRDNFMRKTKNSTQKEIIIWRKWINMNKLNPEFISGINLQSSMGYTNLPPPPIHELVASSLTDVLESMIDDKTPFIPVNNNSGIKISDYTTIPKKILLQSSKAVCKIEIKFTDSVAIGTGFFAKVNNSNVVLTAYHNIKDISDKSDITIYFGVKKYYVSKIKAKTDTSGRFYDAAILKLKRKPKNIVPLKYNQAAIQKIAVIGYPCNPNKNEKKINNDKSFPFGGRGEMCYSFGNVEELNRNGGKHSANTLKGNSGSPVISSRGEFIGIHNAGRSGFEIYNSMKCGEVLESFFTNVKVNCFSASTNYSPSYPIDNNKSFLKRVEEWIKKFGKCIDKAASCIIASFVEKLKTFYNWIKEFLN